MARIDELPVPDWGLKCPHCSASLAGLPEHRCGTCGEMFNVFPVVACHRPILDLGVRCPECDYEYAMREAMRPPTDFARDPWTCPGCQEEVPAGFEISWSCGHSHPDAEADTPADPDSPRSEE